MNTRRLAGITIALVLAAWICGTAAAQEMTINEISDVSAGELLTISGTTNIAAGDRLLVTVAAIGFEPTNASAPGGVEGTSGTVIIQEGNATANTWSFEVDTTGFEPGEYLVAVEWVEGEATTSTTFNVTEAGPAAPTATVTTPAATATTPPAEEPSPTAAGPAIPLAVILAAIAGGYLKKR
ncbi:hypothetical protein [Methanoculleus sp.]|uniref:hypothetical protein n=1 Tax=Methanoculleus sp. TaxID=90427 RepID=UPI0025F6EA61|nr:hypothetical protein [Methanoculleus sp.]